MTRSLLTLLLLSIAVSSTSAQGVWTWLHGDTLYQAGTNASRGVRGVPSPTNMPQALDWGYLTHWSDNDNNLWLIQKDSFGLPDLSLMVWKYNMTTNHWTWMTGYDSFKIKSTYSSSVINDYKSSLFGANPSNIKLSINWVDNSGNYWFVSNDYTTNHYYLTKFNIQTLEFEIKDYRPNNYSFKGPQGQALAANFPDVIESTYWVKGSDVYVYGGYNRDRDSVSQEMWKYSMATNLWTWLRGEKMIESKSVYGTKGIATSDNQPHTRENSTKNWVIGSKLYLFGGNVKFSMPNDLWEYDITTNQWTWLHGDSLPSEKGVYPSGHCIEDPRIHPSGRIFYTSPIQSKLCDKVFWLYSGTAKNSATSEELWMYKPEENKWLWVSGTKDTVYTMTTKYTDYSYGQREKPALTNKPGVYAPLAFQDKNGSIFTYGGFPIGPSFGNSRFHFYRNEMWRYDPDYSCINYNITDKFIERGSRTYICAGDSTVVRVRKGYDSMRVSPMTAVTLRQTDSTTEVWLRPSVNTSYKIVAYGYRCESFLDSLTLPITVAPRRIGSESKAICQGESYHGKT
ncbi:MAG: kelch repeat-containing protein, partial [Chitinophagales bacterium]